MSLNEKVKALYYGADSTEPRDMNWSEGYTETWEVIQPYDIEDFEKFGDPWEYNEDTEEKLGYGSYDTMEQANQPMMNYFYPFPKPIDKDDAQKLEHLNICAVYLTRTEEYGFALTGGGMDLSWDIVSAYVRLGYLPPVHFHRLPRFAGWTMNERRRLVVRAMMRSIEENTEYLNRALEYVKRFDELKDGESL